MDLFEYIFSKLELGTAMLVIPHYDCSVKLTCDQAVKYTLKIGNKNYEGTKEKIKEDFYHDFEIEVTDMQLEQFLKKGVK